MHAQTLSRLSLRYNMFRRGDSGVLRPKSGWSSISSWSQVDSSPESMYVVPDGTSFIRVLVSSLSDTWTVFVRG